MRPQSIVLVAGWWVGAILAGTGNVTNFPADWGPIHIAALIILTVAASLVADGVLGTRFDPVIAGYAHEHVGLAAVFDFILGAITASAVQRPSLLPFGATPTFPICLCLYARLSLRAWVLPMLQPLIASVGCDRLPIPPSGSFP